MHEGTITRIVMERGFGFIGEAGQPDVFFHASDLADGMEFCEQLLELRVRFNIIATAKGLRAANVQAAI